VQTSQKNQLYYGDNLGVLREHIKDESDMPGHLGSTDREGHGFSGTYALSQWVREGHGFSRAAQSRQGPGL
jgi:hypothetical protein